MNIKKLAIAVALATTDEILRVDVSSFTELGLQVKNTGANPLDAFEVWGKTHLDAPEELLASVAGDFSAPVYPMRNASAMVTLAAAATGHLFMSVSGLAVVILKASSSTGATTAEVYGSCT